MEWTNEKLLSFINDYRKCKVLWDIRNPNYKHNGNKRKILITIGQKYGMDEGSVRKKIKNLRSAFHREHHRLMNKIKDDHESEDVRKWFAYDALKFILDVTGPYMTKREDINSAEESFQEEDYDNDEEPFDIRTQYIQLPEETDDSPERTKSPEEQKVSAATSKEEDEYDLFGRSMTMQLRKMPELVALHLMQKMQQMVFNAKKQLIKAKNKTKVRVPPPETHNNLQSKKRVISPSPMPHKSSSQSTPMYKFETISPDDTGAEDNTDKFFYEYMITAEEEKRASQELASENLKQQLKRKGLKSIDPLEVKRSKD
ncbi:uncharacterized protein LOC125230123 isoform X1 [Leguminivora glycinivorella]|uniref:uncharacterized protein LOC125230123 isoform X1 n=1 Tax=Leguminivora glycinivorella TaxID=1035111 RepID=UPI00200DCB6B|nr:uncharacterized protein LOC125230123 isoform X1 [Leguminivora glycinivorella]